MEDLLVLNLEPVDVLQNSKLNYLEYHYLQIEAIKMNKNK